jgi:hypothetical protein
MTQNVVAARPSRSPACASTNAPVQMDAIRFEAAAHHDVETSGRRHHARIGRADRDVVPGPAVHRRGPEDQFGNRQVERGHRGHRHDGDAVRSAA